MANDILYRRWSISTQPEQDKLQVILPKQLGKQTFDAVHTHLCGGHMGSKKTIQKARKSVYWYGMNSDIERWCKECEVCQRNKKSTHKPKYEMKSYLSGEPGQRIGVDLMTNLRPTKAGNRNIIVIQDYFTKYAEAYPCKDETAVTVATVLVKEWITKFGTPPTVIRIRAGIS